MNLPEYRRAIRAVHEEFADRAKAAATVYYEEMARAGDELSKSLHRIDAEFHDDPEDLRAVEASVSMKRGMGSGGGGSRD